MPKLLKFNHTNDFINEITYLIEEKILDAYEKNGMVRLALSGGNTPVPIYQKLANSQVIPWERVEIYLVDERYVSMSDPASNQGKIIQIFGPIMSFLHAFEAWDTDLAIEDSAEEYHQILDSLYDETDYLFDLVILGMGEDGHTASLFPTDKKSLKDDKNLSIFCHNDSVTPKDRLSLTFKAILNSEDAFILITGNDKIKTLEKALDKDKTYLEFPIRKVIDEHLNTTIFALVDEKDTSNQD